MPIALLFCHRVLIPVPKLIARSWLFKVSEAEALISDVLCPAAHPLPSSWFLDHLWLERIVARFACVHLISKYERYNEEEGIYRVNGSRTFWRAKLQMKRWKRGANLEKEFQLKGVWYRVRRVTCIGLLSSSAGSVLIPGNQELVIFGHIGQ